MRVTVFFFLIKRSMALGCGWRMAPSYLASKARKAEARIRNHAWSELCGQGATRKAVKIERDVPFLLTFLEDSLSAVGTL